MGTKRTVGDVPSCTPTLVAGERRGEQITKIGWFADLSLYGIYPCCCERQFKQASGLTKKTIILKNE